MPGQLQALIDLQQQDLIVDKLKLEKGKIPQEIIFLDENINSIKKSIEEIKKELNQKQIQRKNKEIELETKEEQIKKHQGELNVIKSNEAYRALLTEIERDRQEKNNLEEAVLSLMEESEQIAAKLKKEEQHLKDEQKEVSEKKSQLEKQLEEVTGELSKEEEKRKILAEKVSVNLLSGYDRIRKAKGGVAIVVVKGEVCGGCRRILPPHLINEARKDRELVYCENCSRILYCQTTPQLNPHKEESI